MKKIRLFFIIAASFLLYQTQVLQAQQVVEATIPIRGRVISDDSRTPLEYASVSINNTNISTVTNQDGFFSLRIPASARNYLLKVQHLGYSNVSIPVITLIDKEDNEIRMRTGSIQQIGRAHV